MTYDEQVEALAKSFYVSNGYKIANWNDWPEGYKSDLRDRARQGLSALGIEPPKPLWPTDASLEAAYYGAAYVGHDVSVKRNRLRSAFLADPIIEAAVAWRDGCSIQSMTRLREAINEAGL